DGIGHAVHTAQRALHRVAAVLHAHHAFHRELYDQHLGLRSSCRHHLLWTSDRTGGNCEMNEFAAMGTPLKSAWVKHDWHGSVPLECASWCSRKPTSPNQNDQD
ncbi:hypothetical protein F441_09799, partial [Phytophthora nicotianae CJ01A1]